VGGGVGADVCVGGGVGRGVVAAGGVVDGGGDVGSGVALVGAGVGAVVVMRIETLGSGDDDVGADALGDADPFVLPITRWPPRNSTASTTSVSRLPATAASSTSTHRGPRRGGGMSLVVSVGVSRATSHSVARTVPSVAERALTRIRRCGPMDSCGG